MREPFLIKIEITRNGGGRAETTLTVAPQSARGQANFKADQRGGSTSALDGQLGARADFVYEIL